MTASRGVRGDQAKTKLEEGEYLDSHPNDKVMTELGRRYLSTSRWNIKVESDNSKGDGSHSHPEMKEKIER